MGSQYIVRDCRLVYIYLFVVGNNNIIKEIIMNSLFLFIIFLVSINIDSFSQDTKSCKCQIINEFMDNMEAVSYTHLKIYCWKSFYQGPFLFGISYFG